MSGSDRASQPQSDRFVSRLRHLFGRFRGSHHRQGTAPARPRSAARLAIDLNDVVSQAIEMLSQVTGDRIRLNLHLSSDPVAIVAEIGEIERILLNLALNARHAMADGGTLTIDTALISSPSDSTETASPRAHARLTVADTGSGMTPEVKARMFEPFFTTKEEGTGLGLSSVAFTVRQLGGTVSVETRLGRGTSVSVTFPAASRYQL